MYNNGLAPNIMMLMFCFVDNPLLVRTLIRGQTHLHNTSLPHLIEQGK